MSEQARKMFDIDEQYAKNLIRNIADISPVITIIRNWGKTEQEYIELTSQCNELRKKLNCFKKTISFLSEDDVARKSLEAQCAQMEAEIKEINKKARSLKKANAQSEEEVVRYMQYSKTQNSSKSLWSKVLNSIKIDNENVLCILFLLHTGSNIGVTNQILAEYFKDYPIEITDDWNRFLDYVKYN